VPFWWREGEMNLGDVESEGSGGFGVLGEWYGG